jgi:hypothetical protein
MAVRTALVLRNVAYWDEIDTVLDFLLKLSAAPTAHDVFTQLFALNNEHRIVTSRVLLALSYWLTGTVNLAVLGVVGNLFVVGACAVLVATAGTLYRKLQLALLLACLLFQLQHFENFFWPGSSIDHFQVVTLATVAFVGLARGTSRGLAVGGTAASLATFTLAQGLLVWPVGALALAAARRWRALGVWIVLTAFAAGCFFTGFRTNTGHAIGDFSLLGLGRILHYWLLALGAPVAFGQEALAPYLGAALLGIFATQLRPGVIARERIALPLATWAIGALLLIALGRVDVVQGHVHSRYYVLSGLAWALVLFVQCHEWHDPAQPDRLLRRTLPWLLGFNLAANFTAAHDARSWIICRDSAVEDFLYHGRDGQGSFSLHPVPAFTDLITRRVEQAGLYHMPELCREISFASARPVDDIIYYVDRIPVSDTHVAMEGWVVIPGRESRPGQIHLILHSQKSRRVFTTVPVVRGDVGAAYPKEKWRDSGFRFQLRRWHLPAEDFQIGFLLTTERGVETIMTAHRLDLTGPGRGIIATGR